MEVGLELQSGGGETYEVAFPFEDKLGMLLERFDEPLAGGGAGEATNISAHAYTHATTHLDLRVPGRVATAAFTRT